MTDEKFEFTGDLKKKLIIFLIVGIVALVLGIILVNTGGHHGDEHAATQAAEHATEAAGHAEAGDGHGAVWLTRLKSNLWINNVFFAGLALIGVFFVAIQYVAQAGWSAPIKRVAEPYGYWLPVAGGLMLILFFWAGHDIFHWTHGYLYDEFLEDGSPNPDYDPIIAGKTWYLSLPFYIGRMVVFFAVWFLMFLAIRKQSLLEDIHGGDQYWRKMVQLSAIFIVFFAVSSSMAAWDWVMSIDTHWFSTMFGWYVFASWWVAGLASITLLVLFLKDRGYLQMVNSNHLHDLGKFIWAFSIFWTYIWFSQFLLIYYANIPEESVYFVERLTSDQYRPVFYVNLILNFFLPFLLLMTRDAKRHSVFLKLVCIVIIFGHWLDFYLMVTPGVMKENGGLGFLEIGTLLIFSSVFIYVLFTQLAKTPLVAKHHPMMEESLHHHI